MLQFDVLLVTAVLDEYQAVIAAGGDEDAWTKTTASTGLVLAYKDLAGADGKPRTIAVTQALAMGGASAVAAVAELLKPHEVQCLAMCGTCAGKRGEVELGDVIVAERVWQYGAGKRKASTVRGKRVVHEQEDIEMYRLQPPAWKQKAERFEVDVNAAWLKLRPRAMEAQSDWVLERLIKGRDPRTDRARKVKCPDFDRAVARLRGLKLIKQRTLELTADGRKYVAALLQKHGNRLPKPIPFKVHTAPMASGSQVMADDEIFVRLSTAVRKVLGVEMEAAAIGALAYMKSLPYSVVMKGVMDHADHDKDDRFKKFAARASAEVLLAFVREHVPPRERHDPMLVPGTSPLPRLHGPAALLNARHQVVPFQGRYEVLNSLRAWCEGEENVAVHLIHAAGGMGKTRLAIELCGQMRSMGWRAGFAPTERRLDELLNGDRRALAVVDYAESRRELASLLKSVAGRTSHLPLRILLLARNADEWWTDLARSDGAVADLLRQDAPIRLPTVVLDRALSFREAVKAFSGTEFAGEIPPLEDSRYERVLYVHAAALAAAKGHAVHVDALMDDTLDHEERFWRAQLGDDRLRIDDMRQVVAALTLKGGAGSFEEVLDIVALIRGAPDPIMASLVGDLYPGRAPLHVGGIEPDLLGEALVRRTLSKAGATANAFLDRVLAGANVYAIRTAFTVLGRISEEDEAAARWIASVLTQDVAGRTMEALAAAKIVGERTAYTKLGGVLAEVLAREGTVELAARLDKELPKADETVSLRSVGKWVLETLLANTAEDRLEDRAALYNDLGATQRALGLNEDSLKSTEQAVEIYRKLNKLRPSEFLRDLAMSLNNLGNGQHALGQNALAAASLREAIELYRNLANNTSPSVMFDFATALGNLGNALRALGQNDAALRSAEEAVRVYTALDRAFPRRCRHELAMSLQNLGIKQNACGQNDAAFNSVLGAVEIYRELARARPEAVLPDLAMALNNLSGALISRRDFAAAFACSWESVDIYVKLDGFLPQAFLPEYAASLNNLSLVQSALGQRDAALDSCEKAVRIYDVLAKSRPDFGEPYLGIGRYNLALRHRDRGNLEEAVRVGQGAAVLFRRFVSSGTGVFSDELATTLQFLSALQVQLGDEDAAGATRTELEELLARMGAEAQGD